MKCNTSETVHVLMSGYNSRMETETSADLVCHLVNQGILTLCVTWRVGCVVGRRRANKQEISFRTWNSGSAEYLACPEQRYKKNTSLVPTITFLCYSEQKKKTS